MAVLFRIQICEMVIAFHGPGLLAFVLGEPPTEIRDLIWIRGRELAPRWRVSCLGQDTRGGGPGQLLQACCQPGLLMPMPLPIDFLSDCWTDFRWLMWQALCSLSPFPITFWSNLCKDCMFSLDQTQNVTVGLGFLYRAWLSQSWLM